MVKSKTKFRGSRKLSQSLEYAVKPIFARRGFAETRIITDWYKIVGKQISSFSQPRKISFKKGSKVNGILYIEVYDGGMATQITYMQPQIIERISCYFGYKAIDKIKIIQKPLDINLLKQKVIEPYVVPEIGNIKSNKLKDLLSNIEDDELKKSLSNLGTNIYADID